MEDINYAEKIATFNLLVGNDNQEIAFNYLSLANWDETKAAMLYNEENKGPQNTIQSNKNTNARNYTNNNFNNSYSTNYQPYKKQKVNLAKLNKYKECPIFSEGILDIFKIFKSDNRPYYQYFSNISSKCVKLYDNFLKSLKTKVGIILLYSGKTLNNALNILKNICNNDITKDLLSQTVIYPLINDSLEGSKISKKFKLKDKNKDFPVILICFYKNEENFAVIDLIKNIEENIKLLNEKLLEAHDLFNDDKKKDMQPLTNNSSPILNQPKSENNNITNKQENNNKKDNNIISNQNNNIINNSNNNSNNPNNQNIINDINNYLPEDIINENKINRDSYTYMTDGEVLEKQEREMRKLEKMEEDKKLEAEKKEREKKEEEEREKQEELNEKKKAESILNMIPEEPKDDNPDKCVILFRFPDGEKVVERKFLKTDNISLLYLYIKSLGREIYDEKEEKHFSLIQSFPFKNFDELQNNTLEQEGLFPNAMLQIRTTE